MKLKQTKRPLRVHLAIGFLIFSALLLVVLWMFQTVFLESFYKSIKTRQVQSCANSLADHFDADNIGDLIADIEEQNNMVITVFNTDDTIFTTVYSSTDNPALHSQLRMSAVYELYQCAIKNDGEFSTITRSGVERRFDQHTENEPTDGSAEAPTISGGNDPGAGFSPDNGFNNPAGGSGWIEPSEFNGAPAPTNAAPQENVAPSQAGGLTDNPPAQPSENNNASGFQAPDNRQDNASPAPAVISTFSVIRTAAAISASEATEPTESSDSLGTAAFNGDKREPSLERESVETLAFAKVIDTADGERLIIVESEITPVTSVVETLRFQLIIMTAVIILLSIVVAVFVAKLIAKPISDTNEKAKALARQDYDIPFEGGRYREITELNATLSYAAQELKKVDSLQKELIANISHDLRTPLTMITGYSEVMRDLPGEMTPENIQIIIDEATRLNSLVTDLLDISRLQSGTADIKNAPFSLTKSIKSIFARYTKLIENDGLNIVFEHDGEVFIMGDELRMTQVLYNLINNAINYIGEDKTVIVRQTVQDEKVRIDVIDHGEGIPKDKLDYIWDRYYRVDKEHRRAKIGTGLGLSIVKNTLIAHNADFGVASKLGEGSDFYFILPIIPTDDE